LKYSQAVKASVFDIDIVGSIPTISKRIKISHEVVKKSIGVYYKKIKFLKKNDFPLY
jgi:hypothetical protein